MIFPGYGSQFVGMGKDLYDKSRIMQEYFEEAATCLPINFVKLCFASSDIELSYIQHAYPSIFLLSCSLQSILKEAGIVPDIIAGYDTGLFAALFAAQGISFPDGIYLINKYARLYQEMLDKSEQPFNSIRTKKMPTDELEELVRELTTRTNYARIAIYETPTQHIITGHESAIDAIREQLFERKLAEVQDVGTERGLHAAFMDDVSSQLKPYFEKVDFHDLAMPVYTATDVLPITEKQMVKDHVLRFMSSPMLWSRVIEHMVENVDLIVEIGPNSVLCKLIKEQYPDSECIAINTQEDVDALKKIVLKNNTDKKINEETSQSGE